MMSGGGKYFEINNLMYIPLWVQNYKRALMKMRPIVLNRDLLDK